MPAPLVFRLGWRPVFRPDGGSAGFRWRLGVLRRAWLGARLNSRLGDSRHGTWFGTPLDSWLGARQWLAAQMRSSGLGNAAAWPSLASCRSADRGFRRAWRQRQCLARRAGLRRRMLSSLIFAAKQPVPSLGNTRLDGGGRLRTIDAGSQRRLAPSIHITPAAPLAELWPQAG